MYSTRFFFAFSVLFLTIEGFSFAPSRSNRSIAVVKVVENKKCIEYTQYACSALKLSKFDDAETEFTFLSKNDQLVLGVAGTIMSLVVLFSEYVLKTSGCGLPAGPYGIIGAMEGISYLGVTAITATSFYKKNKTGSGLPAGPKGLLGLAEGLSFLAIILGLGVLGFQILDYGYVPNAVPMEGGMCQ